VKRERGLIINYGGGSDRSVPLDMVEDVLVRRGFGPDMSTLKEWTPTYKRMEHEIRGHKVLDIGANIGVFSVRAMLLGAKEVVAVEPESGAASVLRLNLHRFHTCCRVIECAVTASVSGSESVALYVPSSGNAVSATSARAVRGRRATMVDGRTFSSLLREYRPSLVKLDCEGAELDFLDGTTLPSHVKVVCGELHREHGNEARCRRIIKSFSGWEAIHEPASYSFARCWTVAWRRS
jgi:FkbM family methyltransferase